MTQPWVVMVGDVEIHRADTWVILPIDSTQQQADQKLSLSCGVTIPPKRSMPPRKETGVWTKIRDNEIANCGIGDDDEIWCTVLFQ
ncbi:MAG: hypothetical protein DSM106950_18150 [Stigonema ocellatum SAG 48.90 = DSM 106950]|nr:hypothetical protein [Stigonema ocellatum SAG 48.90 = DSM 106950]